MIRRTVPNDNSCLFYAFAYCCEGAEASRTVEQRLRTVVADAVKADPDQETRALILGKPVPEYASWIMNSHHWGGENEVVILADHYKVEVTIVNCESMRTMTYGQGPSAKGRIYLLYTGSHYDPLVAASDPACLPVNECKVQPIGDNPACEQASLKIASEHVKEAARKAAQKTVEKIKCGGCGALLDTNEQFQEHCMEVEHSDDFCYDCEKVTIVYEGNEGVPEGTIDLEDEEHVRKFYSMESYMFSNLYPAAVELDGFTYKTAEHAWHSLKYATSAPGLAAKIQQAATVDEAVALSQTEGYDKTRPDWDDVKCEVLLKILRAKFQQNAALKQELLSTGKRLIVNVGTDEWAGMSAAGGIPKGANNMGKALMQVREELATTMAV